MPCCPRHLKSSTGFVAVQKHEYYQLNIYFIEAIYPRKVTNPSLVEVKKLKHVQMPIQLKKLLHCTPPKVIVDILKWYGGGGGGDDDDDDDDDECDLNGIF